MSEKEGEIKKEGGGEEGKGNEVSNQANAYVVNDKLLDRFLNMGLQCLPFAYVSQENNRLMLLYFIIGGYDIRGKISELDQHKENFINWIYSQQLLPDPSDPGWFLSSITQTHIYIANLLELTYKSKSLLLSHLSQLFGVNIYIKQTIEKNKKCCGFRGSPLIGNPWNPNCVRIFTIIIILIYFIIVTKWNKRKQLLLYYTITVISQTRTPLLQFLKY